MLKYVSLLLAGLMLLACSKKPEELTAAPLGDRAVLESLAESYTEVSDDKLSVSPMMLGGEERKQFVVQVFANSGYSYSKTLAQMAESGIDKGNKLHVDMAELVLMPHRHPRIPTELTKIYSSEELLNVAAVERQLNK